MGGGVNLGREGGYFLPNRAGRRRRQVKRLSSDDMEEEEVEETQAR